jgi:hypothetical protein
MRSSIFVFALARTLSKSVTAFGFTPCIFLRKLFRLALPHAVLDIVNIQLSVSKDLIDLVDCVRVILGTRMRQVFGTIRLVFRKPTKQKGG